ncbi:hypothetical protein [Sphingomonas sp. PB4P5]|uniref:hypothetical protein n=1 Tax=Parasphingomonas puruogangriensis TaxID=3096155 RepID=UPI002FCC0D52
MRYPILLTAAALTLSACDSTPVANNIVAAAPAAPAGPAFATTGDQAVALIEGLGAPWAGGTRKDGMRDAKTGGTVSTITAAGGSAQVFAWPGGAVWQVRLIAGGASGCGDIAQVRAALPKLVEGVTAKPTPAQLAAISDDLNDPKTSDHTLPAAKVSVVGGCRLWVTATAA